MSCQEIQAVVFDWAGTTIDFGSLAPAAVFQQVFQSRGIEITTEQAREPMGMAKREHIAAIGAMPEIALAWRERFGQDFNTTDVDALYEEFLPLQKNVLSKHCDLIPGAVEAASKCRQLGLKIGSSTGYTRELMQQVSIEATRQGYTPELVLCSEDAPRGRPAPYLLFQAAQRFDVFPMWRFVKVDDTVAGVQAGRNAGCWTIGISKTGNLVGKSEAELAELGSEEVASLCRAAEDKLSSAGADYVVESVANVPQLIEKLDDRCRNGERPSCA